MSDTNTSTNTTELDSLFDGISEIPNLAAEAAQAEEAAPIKVDVSLTAAGKPVDPKAGYIKIHIDEAEGMGNYETVGVNGVVYQIKRGEDVAVPPAVVEVLKNAIATKSVLVENPDGSRRIEFRNYASIPWRKV